MMDLDFAVSLYQLPVIKNVCEDFSRTFSEPQFLRRSWQMRPPTYTKQSISRNHYQSDLPSLIPLTQHTHTGSHTRNIGTAPSTRRTAVTPYTRFAGTRLSTAPSRHAEQCSLQGSLPTSQFRAWHYNNRKTKKRFISMTGSYIISRPR